MTPALLLLADKSASVGSGAVLTLVLPLGFTIIALGVWWYVAVHIRATKPPGTTIPELDPPVTPGAPAGSAPGPTEPAA